MADLGIGSAIDVAELVADAAGRDRHVLCLAHQHGFGGGRWLGWGDVLCALYALSRNGQRDADLCGAGAW